MLSKNENRTSKMTYDIVKYSYSSIYRKWHITLYNDRTRRFIGNDKWHCIIIVHVDLSIFFNCWLKIFHASLISQWFGCPVFSFTLNMQLNSKLFPLFQKYQSHLCVIIIYRGKVLTHQWQLASNPVNICYFQLGWSLFKLQSSLLLAAAIWVLIVIMISPC